MPRSIAICSRVVRWVSASMVAWTMLNGLLDPRLLVRMSWIPDALQHRAHRAAGDDAGTRGRRTEEHLARAGVADDLVRERPLGHRHGDHGAPGRVDRLADRLGHLVRLAGADPHLALLVADGDERGEGEAASALDHLGDAVDVDHVLLEVGLAATLAAAPAAIPAAPALAATTAALAALAAATAARTPAEAARTAGAASATLAAATAAPATSTAAAALSVLSHVQAPRTRGRPRGRPPRRPLRGRDTGSRRDRRPRW